MWIITFVILQVLFASGIVSAEDEISTEMILDVLCNDDNAETASIAVECFDAQDTEDFHPALKSCKGIDEVNSETMKEWYCSHTLEEIQSADDCAAEMMEDKSSAELPTYNPQRSITYRCNFRAEKLKDLV
ncbi:hypothetical protein CDAR_245401 [Caerostris darwini]|uniref:Secreted protein n=1 Tax=Caerostris darwini TaxID=1538125 RepID=A0AAV4NYF0_9ARAC|nr:hypothetical protein CDAR_245401 [Caerostris darwini]